MDYNTTPSTYVLSKGSQAYFNTSGKSVSDQHGKENLCFVKGVTDCAVKRDCVKNCSNWPYAINLNLLIDLYPT